MNAIWSTYIQSIGTLYESRKLRFSDRFKNKYVDFFQIPQNAGILEIGCGPGTLAEALLRWYPDSQICAIDRDSSFISFAQSNNKTIQFMEGDATKLPYKDNSFDITISHTVAEHIEPSLFYGEQYRVLKEGGQCIVLYARNGVHIAAPCIEEETEFEKEIWSRSEKLLGELLRKYAICAYPQNEAELPSNMEQYGFQNVTVEYITLNLTPDDPNCSREMAHAIINANRRNAIDNIDSLLSIAPNEVTQEEVRKLKELVNQKYDKRIELYDMGKKQWDTDMALIMMVKGTK